MSRSGRGKRFAVHLLAVILLTTILFVCLYYPFLFKGKMYAYRDIGSDTKNAYLPQMVYDLRSFESGQTDMYRLDKGLGEYYPSLLYKYVNVVNVPILLFGEKNLYWGVLAATYLKYLVIGVFGWLFFRRLIRNDTIALCCALVWTYSGYSLLWGQHYHLLTSICAFTVELYGLQLFLETDKKRFLIIPAMACLEYTGYFYLWMGTFLVLGYSLCYLIFKGERFTTILKKALLCIGALIWAFFIAGEYMFPSMTELLGSTRVGNIASEEINNLSYSKNYIIAFAARLLSPNLLGVGSSYAGPTNYYEMAEINAGILFFFCMSVLILHRRTRAKAIGLFALCWLLLCCPYASKVFSMRSTTQRWSFILQIAQAIAIGYGLKVFLGSRDAKKMSRLLIRGAVVTDIIVTALFLVVYYGQKRTTITVRNDYAITLLICLLVFNVLALVAGQLIDNNRSYTRVRRAVSLVVLGVICAEIIVNGYPMINNRKVISQEEWDEKMYYDGTEVIAQWIKDQDDGLYRVNKTYDSVSRNDEMVQGYNGLAVYNSLNSAWLVRYYKEMGYNLSNTSTTTASNYLRFSSSDMLENNLLGVRYMISRSDNPVTMLGFEPCYEDKDLGLTVYRNTIATSFGYLYEDEVEPDVFSMYGRAGRKILQSKYFYYTSEKEIDPEELNWYKSETLDTHNMSDPEIGYYRQELLNTPVRATKCDTLRNKYGLRVIGDEDDMQLSFEELGMPLNNRMLSMTVTITSRITTNLQVFFASEDEPYYTEGKSAKIKVRKGTHTYSLGVSAFENVSRIRIDPSEEKTQCFLIAAAVEYIDTGTLSDNIEKLYSNGTISINQKGNNFVGDIYNPSSNKRMLCLPLIYSEHWVGTLDGEEIEVCNINGGLTGIEIEPGKHTLRLLYRNIWPRLGRLAGMVSFGAYILFAIGFIIHQISRSRRRRRGQIAEED